MSALRFGRGPALLAALALAASGCASAQAVATPDAPGPTQPAETQAASGSPAATDRALRLPGVTGRDIHAASAQLAELGLSTRVVAFDDSTIVTAQFPSQGATASRAEPVTLWLGTPPPPPPPPPPAASPSEEPATMASASPAPQPAPTAAASPAAKQSPGAAPAPPPAPSDPPPPRTSPRKQPPAEVGATYQGLASWYGPGFEGRGTACGEKFDPQALTLASRELRCGTTVKITGPSGKSVEATVNDWGPAEWTGRRFDLSRATFEAIHPLSTGVIDVTVEVLAP